MRNLLLAAAALCALGTVDRGGTLAQEVIRLPADDRWLAADFEQVFRVGEIDGEEWEEFGEVVSLAFDRAGNLHILDRMRSRVLVVDVHGGRVREYGRAGEGPGEFEAARWIGVRDDGRTVIFDFGHNGFLVFDSEGGFERLARLPGDASFMPNELDLTADGNAAIPNGAVSSVSIVMALAGGYDGNRVSGRPVARLSLSDDQVRTDTLAMAWGPELEPVRPVRSGPNYPGPDTKLVPPLLVGALPGGGVVFSDSTAYRVQVLDQGGGLERVLVRPLFPKPMTDRICAPVRERDLAETEEQLRVNRMGLSDGFRRALRERDQFSRCYHEFSVIRDLQTSAEGTIWIQRHGIDPINGGPIDLLTPDGRYLGSFPEGTPMPNAFGPDGLLAFIEEDEFQVQSVVVRRMPAS